MSNLLPACRVLPFQLFWWVAKKFHRKTAHTLQTLQFTTANTLQTLQFTTANTLQTLQFTTANTLQTSQFTNRNFRPDKIVKSVYEIGRGFSVHKFDTDRKLPCHKVLKAF